MKKFMILLATVALFAACSDDDEKVEVKDYGMKTFSADLKYQPTGGGMAKDFNCKQQTYFKFGKDAAVAIGEHGKDSWTRFDILPKVPKGMKNPELVSNPNYNVTTSVKGWDMVFTQYVGDAYQGHGPKGAIMPYFLAGVLINTANVEVGLHVSEASDASKAFADLKLADVANVTYKKDINTIGIKWVDRVGMPPTYKVKTNNFYIVKVSNGNVYKLRFVGYYGATKKDKVFKCEYALMK